MKETRALHIDSFPEKEVERERERKALCPSFLLFGLFLLLSFLAHFATTPPFT